MILFSQRRILAIVLLATLAMFFWGLGSIPLLSFNEARRAVPVREMVTSGDWLVPTLNGELYISKPPLIYWLSGLPALILHSTSEWVVRLPSALAAFATTWLVFFSMRRHFGFTTALFSVLILITSAGFTTFSRRSEIEMLFSACCFGSVLAAYEYIFSRHDRRWLNAIFVCLGLAFLAKGPVTLLFYIPLMLVFWWRYRLPEALECLTHWRGWLIALLIALPWYLLVSLKLGWTVWQQVVETDIAGKVESAKFDPLYQYPLWLFGDFLPWCLLLLARPRESFRRWLSIPQQGFFAIAAILPLVIFSLIANKHAKYLLPAYPAWAVLLSLSATDVYNRLSVKGKHGMLIMASVLVSAFLVYFSFLESRVLAHRYLVFPKIAAVLDAHRELPVYSWGKVDPRVVYYHEKTMKVVQRDSLDSALRDAKGILLFVEGEAPEVVSLKMCLLSEFVPYLKGGHKASIWGGGMACAGGG